MTSRIMPSGSSLASDEFDRCKRFEEGLRKETCTLVTASVEWTNFSKLVEAAMRLEKSLSEEKLEKETFKGGRVGHTSGVSREQTSRSEGRRFTPGVSRTGSFKPQSRVIFQD